MQVTHSIAAEARQAPQADASMKTSGQRRLMACCSNDSMGFGPISAGTGRRVAAIVMLFAAVASLNSDGTPSEAFFSKDPNSIDGRDSIAGKSSGGDSGFPR